MYDRKREQNELRQLQRLWEKRIQEGKQRIALTPVDERPRERLMARGPIALSDLELMVVLLGTGHGSCDAFSLADRVLRVLDQFGSLPDMIELQKIDGIGPAKAAIITAAMELARRRIHPRGFRVSWPTDVLPFIRHVVVHKQEHFFCISLNGANEILAIRSLTVGLADPCIHPREVFTDPITDRATSVIVAHNHPSGDVNPRGDDRIVTRELKSAAMLLGIPLLDHIIFNDKEHFSFLENGEL
jgi:DNA repair protein RadC